MTTDILAPVAALAARTKAATTQADELAAQTENLAGKSLDELVALLLRIAACRAELAGAMVDCADIASTNGETIH